MSAIPPSNWTSAVVRAAWSLLFVALAAYIVWWLLEPLLPALVIGLALIGILRLAVGWFRHGGW